ncbi:unannotated protein [freshwater metagenome]|uniref:Unannotated protein n=1 Tax=freshwater metagenome TaxID=449393 RepID=A0A6J7J0F3_9ZZZZ
MARKVGLFKGVLLSPLIMLGSNFREYFTVAFSTVIEIFVLLWSMRSRIIRGTSLGIPAPIKT